MPSKFGYFSIWGSPHGGKTSKRDINGAISQSKEIIGSLNTVDFFPYWSVFSQCFCYYSILSYSRWLINACWFNVIEVHIATAIKENIYI